MTEIQGVDYSTTAHAGSPSVAALKAAGKKFVGAYAVNDKQPSGRGITRARYEEFAAAGIDVFLYWESSASWMQAGYQAGVVAANNAQANIIANGMPETMPVYFACDWDATPEDQAAIDACLLGCASVLGHERVGLYAGYWPLMRAKQNGRARWFCQTYAWSGGNVLDGIHLYQYDNYGNTIDGTDVDFVVAYQENYGQASKFTGEPEPEGLQPDPIWWKEGAIGPQRRASDGAVALAMLGEVIAARTVPLYRNGAMRKTEIIETWSKGTKGKIVGTYLRPNGLDKKPTPIAFIEVSPGKYARARLSAFHPRWPTL